MKGCFDMYKDMVSLLQEKKSGDFEIRHFTITNDNIHAIIRGIMPGKYVQLLRNGTCVMSNTDMEQRTNFRFCRNAHGGVLIGGLGIGMVVMAIQDKEEVKSITVLEKFPEVIDIVGSQLPLNEKVIIINADVFEYKPKQKFDCIYMDIWNYVNSDVYKEMKKLKRKYAHYLKSLSESPKRFNFCWAECYAKNNLRLV